MSANKICIYVSATHLQFDVFNIFQFVIPHFQRMMCDNSAQSTHKHFSNFYSVIICTLIFIYTKITYKFLTNFPSSKFNFIFKFIPKKGYKKSHNNICKLNKHARNAIKFKFVCLSSTIKSILD